jgi:phosphonate transport system ATP-binding protein
MTRDGLADATKPRAEPAPNRLAQASVVIDLAATGLRKNFDGTKEILKNVSFQISRGQAVALVGPNGAGKSTLLRCCVGLLPIDGGSVRLFGEETLRLSQYRLRALRARVGFVFQQHNLVPRLSVLTNVLHGSLARATGPRGWFHSVAPSTERDKALHYLDLVGMAEFAERRADRLSGGQSQRVAIARALMQEPRMVIADEPVASLDPKAAEEIMGLFAGLMEKNRLTFFFSSHHLQHALRYSQRLLGLKSGMLKLDVMTKSVNLANLREIYDGSTGKSWSPASSL